MYILNNGGQKIFISFLLCVWLAELGPPRLDLFFKPIGFFLLIQPSFLLVFNFNKAMTKSY